MRSWGLFKDVLDSAAQARQVITARVHHTPSVAYLTKYICLKEPNPHKLSHRISKRKSQALSLCWRGSPRNAVRFSSKMLLHYVYSFEKSWYRAGGVL